MADDEQDTTDKPTMRVVLKRERALIVPDDLSDEQLRAIMEAAVGAVTGKAKRSVRWQAAWIVIGEFEGASQSKAIRAHTGEPGRPDTKAGDFKAPPVKSWRGGERMVAPPQPLFRAEPLED